MYENINNTDIDWLFQGENADCKKVHLCGLAPRQILTGDSIDSLKYAIQRGPRSCGPSSVEMFFAAPTRTGGKCHIKDILVLS